MEIKARVKFSVDGKEAEVVIRKYEGKRIYLLLKSGFWLEVEPDCSYYPEECLIKVIPHSNGVWASEVGDF